MKRNTKTFLFTAVICLLMTARAFGLDTVNPPDEGISSFASWIVNELGGPLGLIIAAVGALGAWFESKFGSPKEAIWITLLLTTLPFLLAMLLKILYHVQ
jgi:hypothetical protein